MTNQTPKEPALLRIAGWAETVGQGHGDHARIAEDAFVDTFACMAAGVGEPVAVRLIDALCESCQGRSAILFTNAASAPATAALINATAAHATELDDWDNATEAHMSAVIVPALLAVAEPRGTTGAALIDAFLIGLEVGMICGEAINPGHLYGGWHPTSTIGSLGAAAACARLLGLDRARMAHAISLATTNAGLKCQVGTMAKPMFAGTASQCGVQSALMAAAGITASLDSLDGPNGVEAIRSGGQTGGFDKVLQELCRSRWIDRFSLNRKPYPTCGIVHRPIDGIVSLMTKHRLRSGEIAKVDVRISQVEYDYCGVPRPANVDEARFSVAFGVARTIADGQPPVGRLVPGMLKDDAYRMALDKVHVGIHESQSERGHYPPVRVEIALSDGRSFQTSVPYARGWPENPLSRADIHEKFRVNAGAVLGDSSATGLLDVLMGLRNAPELENMLRLSRPVPSPRNHTS